MTISFPIDGIVLIGTARPICTGSFTGSFAT